MRVLFPRPCVPSALLPMLLFGSLLFAQSADAQVDVLFWVAEDNGQTYRAHIMLTNQGTEAVQGWRMDFTMPQAINRIDHVTWTPGADNAHTVEGVGWTSIIQPGGSVWMDIYGTHGGTLQEPVGCLFQGVACGFNDITDGGDDSDSTPTMLDVGFAYTSVAVFDQAYVARLTIQNNTEETFEDWVLEFGFDAEISLLWNAEWARTASGYRVQGQNWNSTLAPGDSVFIGFQGKFQTGPPRPTNCTINDTPCNLISSVSTEDSPTQPGGLTFQLDAAYPNPVRTMATLPLRVATTETVRAVAYDVLGREVALLHEGVVAAGATLTLALDATGLVPGLYLVRAVSGSGQTSTQAVWVQR